MRLVDADALPSALFQKHVHDEEELEPMLYFEDAVKVIENVPTIDAISVEWLRSQIQPYTNDWKDFGRAVNNGAVKGIISMWQKEQEAR